VAQVGDALVQLGVRAIPFGIAAVILGFVLKSVVTQARPADTALPGSRLSVFGTIHPDIFRLSAPLGSRSAGDRIRVASLEPQVGLFDASAKAAPMLTDTSASACPNAPFEERFFGSADDCAASFDERFGPPVRVLASNPLPPEHLENRRADALPKATVLKVHVHLEQTRNEVPEHVENRGADALPKATGSKVHVRLEQTRNEVSEHVENRRADALPKATGSKVHVRLEQTRNEVPEPRKEVPLLEEDGHTAIYDITARTVYLPSGRRLEVHSGFGDLMDNPRHVDVRMQGATPPNVYNLTLREELFHGVRAIRLNPVDGSKMYGRAGILAHPYMLGPNGQSNGCVSFSDYPEFLNAFLRGEVTRLVVVERLESQPRKFASGQPPDHGRDVLKTDRSFQYAAANY
jgi:hypothetical protein